MSRRLWRWVLVAAAIALVLVGILVYVLAGIFGWTALGTGVGLTITWGFAALIVVGLLVRVVFSRRSLRQDLEGVGEPINDLYLGRVTTPPVVKSNEDYSAFPPPHDTGR